MSEISKVSSEKQRQEALKSQDQLNRREALRQGAVAALKSSIVITSAAHLGAEAANIKNNLSDNPQPVNSQVEDVLGNMAKTSVVATATLPYLEKGIAQQKEVFKEINRRDLIKTAFVALAAKAMSRNNNKKDK